MLVHSPCTRHDMAMSSVDPSQLLVTMHLMQQSTVVFDATKLWPLQSAYERQGSDLPSFAEEVTRRLHVEGYIGFASDTNRLTVIPLNVVKRVDFTIAPESGSP